MFVLYNKRKCIEKAVNSNAAALPRTREKLL